MKKIVFILFLFFIVKPAYSGAFCANEEFSKIYDEQVKSTGADKLKDYLPEKTQDDLNSMGLADLNPKNFEKLKPESFFNYFCSEFKNQVPEILKTLSVTVGTITIAAFFGGMKLSLNKRSIDKVLNFVCVLVICIVFVKPVVTSIVVSSGVIKAVSKFLLSYVPIMVGVMCATGQNVLAGSYSLLMLTLGECMAQVMTKFLMPILNIFLSIGIVSALSDGLNLSGVCKSFSKICKWALGFISTLFVGALGIQSIVAGAVDSVGSRAFKFVISGCIPVVGSALSDAFLTVQGCVKLLKSSVGAFFLLAIILTFAPIFVKCVMWNFLSTLCAGIGEAFGIVPINKVLKNVSDVLNILIAVLTCFVVILVISTVIVLNTNPF